MNDLKLFKHGDEGTHSVCNKHNMGDKSVCCECTGKTDCSNSPLNKQHMNDWHEKFNKRFVSFYDEEEHEVDVRSRLTQFIHETLNNQLVTLLEEMPKEQLPDDGNGDEDSINYGRNQVIRTITDLIKSKITRE